MAGMRATASSPLVSRSTRAGEQKMRCASCAVRGVHLECRSAIGGCVQLWCQLVCLLAAVVVCSSLLFVGCVRHVARAVVVPRARRWVVVVFVSSARSAVSSWSAGRCRKQRQTEGRRRAYGDKRKRGGGEGNE